MRDVIVLEVPDPVQRATGWNVSGMSIDQARMSFLDFSLAGITTQSHKLSMEMASIRRTRCEFTAKDASAATIAGTR